MSKRELSIWGDKKKSLEIKVLLFISEKYTTAGKGITTEEEMSHTSVSLLFASLPPFSLCQTVQEYCSVDVLGKVIHKHTTALQQKIIYYESGVHLSFK